MERGGKRELLLNGHGVSVREDKKKFWGWMVVMVAQQCELCSSKWLEYSVLCYVCFTTVRTKALLKGSSRLANEWIVVGWMDELKPNVFL